MKKLFLSILLMLVVAFASFNRPALADGDAAHGTQIFTANCAACHAGGKNVINPQKTLQKADLDKNSMNSLEAVITQVTKGKNAMPAFAGRLSEKDIEDVATYVLSQAEKGW